MTFAPNLVTTNQSIGDALFYAVSMALLVLDLSATQGMLSPDTNATIPSNGHRVARTYREPSTLPLQQTTVTQVST